MPILHPRRSSSVLARGIPLVLLAACSSGNSIGPKPTAYEPIVCGRGNGASAANAVGEGGGTVTVNGHALSVPAGAVNGRTTFRITEREDGHVGVEVEPHGTRFRRPAMLTLNYQRCGPDADRFSELRILEVRSGTTQVLRTLPTRVDAQKRMVTAQLDHLSGYLIGTNRAE